MVAAGALRAGAQKPSGLGAKSSKKRSRVVKVLSSGWRSTAGANSPPNWLQGGAAVGTRPPPGVSRTIGFWLYGLPDAQRPARRSKVAAKQNQQGSAIG